MYLCIFVFLFLCACLGCCCNNKADVLRRVRSALTLFLCLVGLLFAGGGRMVVHL